LKQRIAAAQKVTLLLQQGEISLPMKPRRSDDSTVNRSARDPDSYYPEVHLMAASGAV
jgi:hypothetical protein